MHGASNDELIIGVIGLEEVKSAKVVYKAAQGTYDHNYIGQKSSPSGLRQMVEIVTEDEVSGELSHVLRTEKGMEFIRSTCAGCPPGYQVSLWTTPKEESLFKQAKEGLSP